MKIDNSINEFNKIVIYRNDNEKWDLWNNVYYKKYSKLYNILLNNIYLLDSSYLYEFVKQADYICFLKNATKFIADDGIEVSKKVLNECAKILELKNDFTYYAHIGLGHIGGTALPIENPFVYYGIEQYSNIEDMIHTLSHEVTHLKRSMILYGCVEKLPEVNLGDMVITEGFATVFSSIFCNNGIPNLTKDLFMTEVQIEKCRNNGILKKEVLYNWEIVFNNDNRDLVYKYMVNGINDDIPDCYGYYLGNEIIRELLKRKSFNELIQMKTADIKNEYLYSARI